VTAASCVFVSRPGSDAVRDDAVLPFVVEPLDMRGRVVLLGATSSIPPRSNSLIPSGSLSIT
jgi:hypothetical protein